MPAMKDKPTPEEVAAYAEELGYKGFDGDAFVDHWSARGWLMRPGIYMQDWKASVRTWQRNRRRWDAEKAATTGASPLFTKAEESAIADYAKLAAHIMVNQRGYQIDRLYSKVRDTLGNTALEEVRRRAKAQSTKGKVQ
jgi:hypothetical protein